MYVEKSGVYPGKEQFCKHTTRLHTFYGRSSAFNIK